MIQIAKEVKLRNIKVSVVKSNQLAYIVAGHNFYIAAVFGLNTAGWYVLYVAVKAMTILASLQMLIILMRKSYGCPSVANG